MSKLDQNLQRKENFINYIPDKKPHFHDWQKFINEAFAELSQKMYLKCHQRCKYYVTRMEASQAHLNNFSETDCSQDCQVKWLNPFYHYTELAHVKAERDFENCMKIYNQFESDTKEILECKREKFKSYMESVLFYEQEYEKIALDKYLY